MLLTIWAGDGSLAADKNEGGGSPMPSNSVSIQQRVRHDMLQQTLIDREMVMTDVHVDLGNGFHAHSYINAHPLLSSPSEMMRWAYEMRGRIPHEIRSKAQAVFGPVSGGAVIGPMLAVAIDNERTHGTSYQEVKYGMIHKQDGQMVLRPFYRKQLQDNLGRPNKLRIILVDDVLNTGFTMSMARKLLERLGAEVIGSVTLLDRGAAKVDLPNHYQVDTCDVDPQLEPADDCSLCRAGIPLTVF